MIEQVRDNIYRVESPLPRNPLKWLNSYFIKGEDRNLIIDTGFNMDECRAALYEAVEQLSFDMEKTDIYVTHLHSDHLGLAPEIASESSRIYLSETDSSIILRGSDWEESDKAYLLQGFSPEDLAKQAEMNPARIYAPAKIPSFTTVKDGDVLHYGGHDLEVILVPGHTPGNTVLYVEKEKIMFLGDHVLFDITPNIIAWSGMKNSLGQYCDNLRKVRKYDVELPLPAHRTVHTDFYTRVDEILQHHQERLADTMRIIAQTPGQTATEIASKMKWQIKSSSNKWEDFPIAQKWFAVGEAIAHVDYLLEEGRIRRELDGTVYRYYTA